MDWISDLRLQKIGSHYRAIRRFKSGAGGSWKANDAFGIGEEDVVMEERWRSWCDLASATLKMDILGLDLLVDSSGKCLRVVSRLSHWTKQVASTFWSVTAAL